MSSWALALEVDGDQIVISSADSGKRRGTHARLGSNGDIAHGSGEVKGTEGNESAGGWRWRQLARAPEGIWLARHLWNLAKSHA